MSEGSYSTKPFSPEFIAERCLTHKVSQETYVSKIKTFLDFLDDIDAYDEVVLWFGDDPFCLSNRAFVLKTLEEQRYRGSILDNTVDEYTGEVLRSETIR
ncbi:MAG: hypothetical protein IJ735_06255 [Clostridia bacterium]|nr:hypothetical protein [Clostridia bacterium]